MTREARSAGAESLPLVAVYADESCLGNGKKGDNPGAAGALVEYQRPDGTLVRRDLWVSERSTTNNRMALRSAIETFRALARKGGRFRVVFTSDSRYLIDGMTSWVHGWARKGWRRSGGPIENLELWQEAIRAAAPHMVEWRWVRGHAGHPQNEYANHLATRAAADRTQSDGLVESEYEAWIAKQRAKGGVKGIATPFPTAAEFRAASALPRVPEPA
ncbi:MAG TPA: ribonuclease H [Gemmatimonadales bacterium]